MGRVQLCPANLYVRMNCQNGDLTPFILSLSVGWSKKEVKMDKFWLKIITITGSVGVVGLLFSTLMARLFNAEIVNLLGSEKLFFILVLLILVFTVALLLAIVKPKGDSQTAVPSASNEPSKKIDVSYGNGSTHIGDNNF